MGKKTPFTLDKFADLFAKLPGREDSERSWTVSRADLEARDYDLKATNPNARSQERPLTPDELLAVIAAKGREIDEALAALRAEPY